MLIGSVIFSQDDGRIAYLDALQRIGPQDMDRNEKQQNGEGRGTTRRRYIFYSLHHSSTHPLTISHMSDWRVRPFGRAELTSDWYGCALLDNFETPSLQSFQLVRSLNALSTFVYPT